MSFSITQSVQPNFGLMGPTSGTNKLPSFRALIKKDLPFFSNVENTALSTWAGSANLTTLGTVATGVWNATEIGVTKGGTGKTSIANARLLWSTSANTLGEIALGYGMQVASGELRTPQDLQTSASPSFAALTVNGQTSNVFTGVGSLLAVEETTLIKWNLRPDAGKDGWMTFTENAIADRWAIGIKNGDQKLYILQGNPSSGTAVFSMDSSGSIIIGGNIKTASPSGGTAEPWKLGSYISGVVVATGYTQVEINGVAYKLLTAT